MDYVNKTVNALERHITPNGVKILSLIGAAFATATTLSALRSFCRTFVVFGYNLPERYGRGTWAVITGGAKGIGAALAEKLAALGFNLVLIDVDQIAIAAFALTLEAKHPKIQVKTIITDFTRSLEEGFFDKLMQQMEGLDVSILVNNVGLLGPLGPLRTSQEATILNTLIVNTAPMTLLSRRFIPLMLNRGSRSAIINLSSVAAVNPGTALSIYCSTKVYVDTLSRMIEEDVRHKIDVIAVRPDAVSTEMLGLPQVSMYVVSPQDLAGAILSKVGTTSYAHGHWRHEISCWFRRSSFLSKSLTRHFFTKVPKKMTAP